jgi:hypothetical protein
VLAASVLAAGLTLLGSPDAAAQGKKKDDWFGGARFMLDIGAFASEVETRIRLDAADLPGTSFSFENDLGLDDNKTVPAGRFVYRFGRHASIGLGHFTLNRDGTSEARISITLPDPDNPKEETITIEENALVSSFFDAQTTVLSFGWSFINNPKAEFGLRFGVHVTGIELGLSTPENPEIPSTAEDVTAPLPTLGITGGYRFGKTLYFTGELGYFALEIGDFDGSITSATAGILWQPFNLVGFGFSYQFFEVDVSATTEDFGGVGGEFRYRYQGPLLYVALRF